MVRYLCWLVYFGKTKYVAEMVQLVKLHIMGHLSEIHETNKAGKQHN